MSRRPTRPSGGQAAVVPVVLTVLTILAQILYPLTDGGALRVLTIGTVLLFTAASLTHAAVTRGPSAALAVLVLAGGAGLAAEAVGVRTGFPFGEYAYAGTLGPQLLEVPLLVPLAWVMMAYPCLLLGRRLGRGLARRSRAARPSTAVTLVTGAVALASWDLFLDPQMVAAGHWTWADPDPGLPGVPGVPLTNYAGWVAVSLVVIALLHASVPDPRRAPEGVPGALLAWTWLGSTLGNAVFFDRPEVAAWGGVAMGVVVAPYLWSLWQGRP